MKKRFLTFALVFFLINYGFSQVLESLSTIALEHNSDIVSAKTDWEKAKISNKTQDGFYMPSLSTSTAAKNTGTTSAATTAATSPYEFSTNITLSQPLLSGTTFSTSGNLSYTQQQVKNKQIFSNTPALSFELTQSLLPFWIYGKQNPVKMNLKETEEYYYNQYIYQVKTVLQNLAQNYICYLISSKEEHIYENTILQLQQQIDAYSQMQKKGSTNLVQISELEHTKWSYSQDLLSVKISKAAYRQNIKTICNTDFDDELLAQNFTDFSDNFLNFIKISTDDVKDPLYNTLLATQNILKAQQVLEKQNSAPQLSLSATTQNSYSVAVDFSPLLESAGKNQNKQQKLELQQLQTQISDYKNQKDFLNSQYQAIITSYENEKENIKNLNTASSVLQEDMKKQYDSGAISKLDYNSFETQYKNNLLSEECINLNIWLYKLLLNLNSDL